ncbi:PhoH family protein [Candidatus Parcubacteria bacterium]|nr:PhoH family protein [Candidatus Parcubacteria bacterium]
MPEKIFVIDTNVLLHSSRAINSFGKNTIIISFTVLEELDRHKQGTGEVNKNARTIIRFMDSLRRKGSLSEGVKMENGGLLKVFANHQKQIGEEIKSLSLDSSIPDNRIIAIASFLKKTNPEKKVSLVSQDINVRLKADALDLEVDEYYGENISDEQSYSGYRTVETSQEEVDRFYLDGCLSLGSEANLFPNEFVVLINSNKPKHSAIGKASSNEFVARIDNVNEIQRVVLRNKEQKMAVALLLDPKVKVVSLLGVAGTGKTLLAIAGALETVVSQEKSGFKKIIVTRPIIPMGKDIGFLPGTKDEKLCSWMQPIFDNLEYLLGRKDIGIKSRDSNILSAKTLMASGVLEMEALTYMRGRTISDAFVIIDEAQNLMPEEVKAICTRCGEGSKFVFTGDPDQIDNPYLDSSSNGLSVMVERAKDLSFFGHVTLKNSERSEVARVFSKIM